MHRLKRPLIVWLALIVFLSQSVSARAAVPLAILAPSLLGAAVLATGATTYYAPAIYDAAQQGVSAGGKLFSALYQANQVYTSAGEAALVGGLVGAYGAAENAYGYMYDHLGDFPFIGPWVRDYAVPSSNTGDIVDPRNSSSNYQITGPWMKMVSQGNMVESTVLSSSGSSVAYAGLTWFSLNTPTEVWKYLITSYSPPYWKYDVYKAPCVVTTNPATRPTIQTGLVSSKINSSMSDGVKGDILKWMNYNPNTLSITEAITPAAADTAPPAAAPSTAQIDAWKAQNAAATADAAADILEQASASDPTNATLAAQAAAARYAAQQAQLAADQYAQDAEGTTEQTPPLEVTPPGAAPAPDADLAIDLSPLLGLKDRALSKFPFSTIAGLGGFFDSLTAAPTAPSFSLPMPFGLQPYNLSLSSLDGIAEKWRLALAFFFHASCIYAIIRRYA